MIKMIDCTSSNIAAIWYDLATSTLAIRFKSAGDKVHHYTGVPPEVASNLSGHPSVGKYFFAHIKGQYEHTVVLDSEADAAQRQPRADVDGEEGLADFSANDQPAAAA